MVTPLSDMPVVQVGDCLALVVPNWKEMLWEETVRFLGKPLRPDSRDLWILTTTTEDALILARLVQRNFMPENPQDMRSRDLTVRRQPTFAGALPLVPSEVACYMSATHRVDDHSILQLLHPAPPRTGELIRWSRKGYEIESTHGHFRRMIPNSPRGFAAALAQARGDLVDEVGPGVDTSSEHLNGSPLLAAMLERLSTPAAEAASHWLSQLGPSESSMPAMVIPGNAIATDTSLTSLHLESRGAHRHVSFWMRFGDIRISELEVEGICIPDTAGVALDARARQGELRLSQILDLPRADEIPVLSLFRNEGGRSWTARLDPVSVALGMPSGAGDYDERDLARELADAGYVMRDDAAMMLSTLGRNRTAFILDCVTNGQSGAHFDISAWTPDHTPARLLLRSRAFILESEGVRTPASFLESLS